MKQTMLAKIERCRMTSGPLQSKAADGFNGAFALRRGTTHYLLIVSDGGGWDHVSVQIVERGKTRRLPTWDEMTWIKELFFDPEETVIQYHPPRGRYVNVNPWVLHLWRPQRAEIPVPPVRFV